MTRYIVRKDILEENIRAVKKAAGKAEVYGVLKANGYGLGFAPMARTMAASGVTRFAVTNHEDAKTLCKLGVPVEEILLMRPMLCPREIGRLFSLPVTFSVGSEREAQVLESAGRMYHTVPRAHIQIDSGMGRYGFPAEEPERVRRLYARFSGVSFTGIYTHFSSGTKDRLIRRQFKSFCELTEKLREAGCSLGVRHCCSSVPMLRHTDMMLDAVRVGSAFLGSVSGAERLGLRPVGSCEAQIGAVRHLSGGVAVGYGASFHTGRDTTTAVLDAGTVNGFGVYAGHGRQDIAAGLRELLRIGARALGLGRKLTAEVNGVRVNVLGEVCSETAVLDVTGVPCRPGDWVRLRVNPLHMGQTTCIWVDSEADVSRETRARGAVCAVRPVA